MSHNTSIPTEGSNFIFLGNTSKDQLLNNVSPESKYIINMNDFLQWTHVKLCYEQINSDIRTELIDKLEEFATYNDSLEEIFENKEQIEVSKFYERLPKPHAIAVQEWLEDKVYHRDSSEEIEE